ncbi:helicase-related protein [Thermodesulforhabdus norvegica]|uniref:Helicase conserved C-terminal domain-containing protein n=1 Tax=Thermodesulforhabdus norvegica TaxID=39841 RepID=A0A1I4VDS2_9BACT|nr:helicase-related protein [Thermodesulforhabdus norvegica]SFM99325.1 Helicase conserved C-terminal domain-containing protein [Thermodesulforhabdus norvegica]
MVDEAHGATPGRGTDRHLRYELVRELAANPNRHLILLTATPHSGIAESFQKLLGLLRPEFEAWDLTELTESQRRELAKHFVQRTRMDIEKQWKGAPIFPKRETVDATYTLSPAYRELFEAVYRFSKNIVKSGLALAAHQRRMRWWSALVLLRCVMSSPRAAAVALAKRRQGEALTAEEDVEDVSPIYEPSDRRPSDEVPTPLLEQTEADLMPTEQRRLRELERMAAAISEAEDKKLQEAIRLVRRLLQQGHNPVVWCYYVDTAEYVAEKLEAALAAETPSARVLCVTGRLGEEERRLKVEAFMREPGRRVLVATDCLSEGINLQKGFDAVIHYDLPWNPNRLEQREGRVDRYGQPKPVVKAVRFYGRDNPVDGAIIRVLLDKAREIRRILGTHVPVPEEERLIMEALVHALFLGREQIYRQLTLLEGPVPEIHRKWELDAQRERESRTRFAQHALKPDIVRRELEATDQVLGDPDAVRNFVLTARQKVGLQVGPRGRYADVWEVITEEAALVSVPAAVQHALPRDRSGRWVITFTSPTPEGAEYLGRNHPFVTALARYLFEQALEGNGVDHSARAGAIRTRAVGHLTALLLLRPRYLIHRPNRNPLLAEEVLVVGWRAFSDRWLAPEEALPLLTAEPTANMLPAEKRELVQDVLEALQPFFAEADASPLPNILAARAAQLEEAHRRVRQSVGEQVRGLKVEPHWPPDILGILLLQPEVMP